MEFTPKLIKRIIEKRHGETVSAEEWNELLNLLINQGDHNSEFLKQIADSNSTTEEVIQMINEAVFDTGNADMCKTKYDKNHNDIVDLAESVIDEAIDTVHIKNGAVTSVKLSDAINTRLDYLYTNVTRLLILIGAQSEIEGSEDLVLFGVDGLLKTSYGALEEKTNILTLADKVNVGDTSVKYNSDVELVTGRTYTLADFNKAIKVKVSNCTTSEVKKSTTNIIFNHGDMTDAVGTAYFVPIQDNVYLLHLYSGFEYCFLYLIKLIDETSVQILSTISQTSSASWYTEHIEKIGNRSLDIITYGNTRIYTQFVVSTATSSVVKASTANGDDYSCISDYNCAALDINGGLTYIRFSSDDNAAHLIGRNGTTIKSSVGVDQSKGDRGVFRPLTGKYGYLRIYHKTNSTYEYYIVNLLEASIATLTSSAGLSYTLCKNTTEVIPTPDGAHFMYQGTMYHVGVGGVTTAVKTINNIPSDFRFASENVIISGTKVYKIVDTECILVADCSTSVIGELPSYALKGIGVNADATEGLVIYSGTADKTGSVINKLTINSASVEFTEPVADTLTAPIRITREQDGIVPAGQTKHIYIVPETKGNTFDSLDLIININRPLTENELLTVEVTANGTTTIIEPLENSGEMTKYYEHTLDPATADIEIVITAKAENTELQVTQILGGVDNAI